jgi:hypothetical protein
MRSDRVTVTRRGSGAHTPEGMRFGMPRVGFLSNKYAPSEGCAGRTDGVAPARPPPLSWGRWHVLALGLLRLSK